MDTATKIRIADSDIAAFERDGVMVLKRLLDAAWVEKLRGAIEHVLGEPGPHSRRLGNGQGRFEHSFRLREIHPDFAAAALSSHLPGVAAQIMRASRVNLFFDQFLVKEPGTTSPTPWHADLPYWPILGTQVMTFWMALDPATRENGRMEFVRGSHRWGRWFRARAFDDRDNFAVNQAFEPVPDIDARRDDYDVVGWDLEVGDAVVFHAQILHTAGANKSTSTRRRAYTARYVGDDIVYDPRVATTPELLVDGLVAGDPITCERYPQVWPARATGV